MWVLVIFIMLTSVISLVFSIPFRSPWHMPAGSSSIFKTNWTLKFQSTSKTNRKHRCPLGFPNLHVCRCTSTVLYACAYACTSTVLYACANACTYINFPSRFVGRLWYGVGVTTLVHNELLDVYWYVQCGDFQLCSTSLQTSQSVYNNKNCKHGLFLIQGSSSGLVTR